MDNLQRFIDAQEKNYNVALTEIKAGHKESHWIWYIFPQIAGLGSSYMSELYAIKDISEAKAYMNNQILSAHLVEISSALLKLKSDDPVDVMGYPDDLKLKSSMTLFYLASKNQVFTKVLDKFYDGKMCELTINILKSQKS